MGIEELINKGIQQFGNPENFKKKQKTLVVIGVARGGTSLIAGVVDLLGVFTGERSKAPVYEDVTLSEAFEANNKKEIIKMVDRYNSNHDIWMFKRPSSINYLHLLDRYLRNPIYLVVFKDTFAIANRNNISMKSNLLDTLNQTHKDYAKILKYFTKRQGKINGIFYSYDKVMQNRTAFVSSIVDIIARENTSLVQIKKAKSFIDPNSKDYLDVTRITKSIGQITKIGENFIEGWAKFLHSSNVAEVELFVNGTSIKTTMANRDSLVSKEPCGFVFSLEEGLNSNEDKIEIKVVGDVNNLQKSHKLLIKDNQVNIEEIKEKNRIEYDVLIAKDNWLFLFQGGHLQFNFLVGDRTANLNSVLNFATNIKERIAYCKENNISYQHIVFPSKPLVKKEFLDNNLQNIVSLFERDYLTLLQETIGVDYDKYFYYPLEVLKKVEQKHSTFLKFDTHTTDYGNIAIVNQLLQQLGMEFKPKNEDFIIKELGGDLATMLQSSKKSAEEVLLMDICDIYREDNRHFLPSNTNNIVITHCKNSKSNLRLLIFGDSFFKQTLNILQPFFKDILYIRSSFMHYDIIEAYSPDVVFTGNAERYMSGIASDSDARNFLLELYGDMNYRPSKSFVEAFKAQLSYGYYQEQYLEWCDTIDKTLYINNIGWNSLKIAADIHFEDNFIVELKYKTDDNVEDIEFQLLFKTESKDSFLWSKLNLKNSNAQINSIRVNSYDLKIVNDVKIADVKSIVLRGKKLIKNMRVKIIDIEVQNID